MTALVFRTDDFTKWGGGLGADLDAAQIDSNFWLLYSMLVALEDHGGTGGRSIDFFTLTGDELFIHMTDHTVLGPYTIPIAQWHPRGAWAPGTDYSVMDVFRANGSLYLVIFAHTSVATFDAGANDGAGHDLYSLLLETPDTFIPVGGTINQRLAKLSATDYDFQWVSDKRLLALFISGKPLGNEVLLRFTATETVVLPASLTTSKASSGTPPAATVTYQLAKNGASIGFIQFAATTGAVTFSFTGDVTLAAGDVLTLTAPSTPDTTHADFSISLVGNIAG